MSLLFPSLHFRYLSTHYAKNLLAILLGLSFTFAFIDYFQHIEHLEGSLNSKILYVFYMWQSSLGMLYPLAIVFAVIMTKLALVKQNTMGVLHAFGYTKRKLFFPIFVVAFSTYLLFLYLHTTSFSYSRDKAKMLLENHGYSYHVNDLFFKYNDTFVYIKKLDPIKKQITDMTIFNVEGNRVSYTIRAPEARFSGEEWIAQNATVKTHHYADGVLTHYTVEKRKRVVTLQGYKPKIIESLYEGKSLNVIDAYNTWKLLRIQHLNSDKIRAAIYDKVIVPLFALALAIILFFKLPFHARMMNLGGVIALSLGMTFLIWGVLFGLAQIGSNGVLLPELTAIVPILLLWIYALYLFFTNERKVS